MINNKLLLKFMSVAVCKRCAIAKLKEDFFWKKSGRIHSYICKECTLFNGRLYKDSEAGKAVTKAYRESEEGKAVGKAYRESEDGRAKIKEWRQSEAGKISIKKCQEKYNKSEVGKVVRKEYRESEEGKEKKKAWEQSEVGKIAKKNYQQSELGKVNSRKSGKKFRKTVAGKAVQERYQQSEKGKMAAARAKAKRRSRNSNIVDDLTLEQWNQILKDQDNLCNGCGISFDDVTACKDHIIPVFDGGGLTKDNVQALCGICNSTKGTGTMKQLMERLSYVTNKSCT